MRRLGAALNHLTSLILSFIHSRLTNDFLENYLSYPRVLLDLEVMG